MYDDFWLHPLKLSRYAGVSSVGDAWDDPVDLVGFVLPGQRMYRTDDGREKLATGTVFLPITVDAPGLNSQITCQSPGLHGRVGAILEWRADAENMHGLPECWELVID